MLAKYPNKLTFRVDNTRSGTGSQDPVLMMKMKEICICCDGAVTMYGANEMLPWYSFAMGSS